MPPASRVRLILNIDNRNLIVDFADRVELIIGRSDPHSHFMPDVDLTDYQADERGVSRRHASIVLHEDSFLLVDKGSDNGTYLNGQRLNPNGPTLLRDGDEIRLGNLSAWVYLM